MPDALQSGLRSSLSEAAVGSGIGADPATQSLHHVVVVGGGFGGLEVVQALAGAARIRVTLVDRHNYHLFQPLLYQVATAVLAPGEIAQPLRSMLSGHKNIQVLLAELQGVDPAARELQLSGGQKLSYDTLVLATGAGHSYFGNPQWENFAPGLKSLEDARRIRRKVLLAFEQAERATDPAERRRLTTFAVIGGGPTGVEMAGAIAGLARNALAGEFLSIDPRQARVLLIEAAPRILGAFPEELSAYAERALARTGVTVMTGHPVEEVTESGVVVAGERFPTATVIWAAGVRASPVAQWLGVEPADRAGHVRVASDLSVPGLANVYALGDAALIDDEDGTPLPGLAQVAHQQGRYLGRTLRARILHGTEPKPFRFRSRGNLAVIGRNAGVVQWGAVKLKGFAAWLVWGVAHIYLLNGFQNRLFVTLRWLWAYTTFKQSARIID